MASNGHKIFSSLEKYLSFCCGWFPSWPCYFIANQNEREKTEHASNRMKGWKSDENCVGLNRKKEKRLQIKSQQNYRYIRTHEHNEKTKSYIVDYYCIFAYMRKNSVLASRWLIDVVISPKPLLIYLNLYSRTNSSHENTTIKRKYDVRVVFSVHTEKKQKCQ